MVEINQIFIYTFTNIYIYIYNCVKTEKKQMGVKK